MNAWAALQTLVYDGWVIRFAEGYTRRANSVNPLYSSSIPIEKKLHFCENLYRSRNLPVVFKICPSVYPSQLDEKLSASGYQKDSLTSVQIVDLQAVHLQETPEAEIQEDLSNEWLENFCRMSAVSDVHRKTLQKILLNIVPSHCFVSLQSNDRVVACGLGVLQSGFVGLFDIVTDQNFRNLGYGRQVVMNILSWRIQKRARKGYLQVMLNNVPGSIYIQKLGSWSTINIGVVLSHKDD